MGHAVHEAIAGERAATVSLNCDFVAGARADEVIEGTATITRRTRSLIFVSGELSVVERPVLTATGIWKIIGQ
jgi:acyl-coenzyme A thioesterase PaaI-like protein